MLTVMGAGEAFEPSSLPTKRVASGALIRNAEFASAREVVIGDLLWVHFVDCARLSGDGIMFLFDGVRSCWG